MKELFHSLFRFSVRKTDDGFTVHSFEVSDELTAKNVLKWVTLVSSPIMTMLTLALTIVQLIR